MCETEPLRAENIGLKDIAWSRRGGTNFSWGTSNVLQLLQSNLAKLSGQVVLV